MTACALLAALLLAYTYVGYPALIGLLARLNGSRRTGGGFPADELPRVTVCLPVYNGARYLPAKIASLLAQDYAGPFEILVYCDGCSDDSPEVARALAAMPEAASRIRVIVEERRLGKPTGLNTMSAAATGDLLLLNDVRQPLSANAMRALVDAMADPDVGCATGNLVLEGGAGSGVYWRYENWIRRQESAFRGVVGITGPLAMMRRAEFTTLPADLILDDVWIPTRLGLQGKRVAFVAEAEARDAAFNDDREFGRKVRTLAGNYQLFARMPQLLVPFRNPFWFETVSHKVLRLAGPWLLMALAASSTAGALRAAPGSTMLGALAVAQLAFYVAAAAGSRLGRAGAVARTFVVLNAAALVGLSRHLTGRQRVTWDVGAAPR